MYIDFFRFCWLQFVLEVAPSLFLSRNTKQHTLSGTLCSLKRDWQHLYNQLNKVQKSDCQLKREKLAGDWIFMSWYIFIKVIGKRLYRLDNKERFQTFVMQFSEGKWALEVWKQNCFVVTKLKDLEGKSRMENIIFLGADLFWRTLL